MIDLTVLEKIVMPFELSPEMPLSTLSSSGLFCGNMETKSVERNADDGGLPCNVREGSLRGS